MAHFSEVDENNIVTRVLVIPDEQEHRGQEYLADDLGLGGRWIQTSYNGNIRNIYAGIGYLYNEELDVFTIPQPYPSWYLNENGYWQAPVPLPDNYNLYDWNEDDQKWTLSNINLY